MNTTSTAPVSMTGATASTPTNAEIAAPATVGGPDGRDLSVYIHVPFCAVRCGYCDFNTYTATELGGGGSQREYPVNAMREMDLTLADDAAHGVRYDRVSTVFFGGGTPTLLPADDLVLMLVPPPLAGARSPRDAEVTTEANPDSVTPASLSHPGLRRDHARLDRHAVRRALGARDAGPHPRPRAGAPGGRSGRRRRASQVSLDLIYGTPGETVADVETSVRCGPGLRGRPSLRVLADHRGEHGDGPAACATASSPSPDPDDMADKYELVDDLTSAAGLEWYEVSNWARTPEHRCRHNLAY
jgi:coproporphyrinogen III oxidase-like Fe-S oxidoreductase